MFFHKTGRTTAEQKTLLMLLLRGFSFLKVPPSGFEPETHGLENRCSIQLSYGGAAQRY